MCLILDDNKDDVMSLGADSVEKDDSASDSEVKYWFPLPQLFLQSLTLFAILFKCVHALTLLNIHQFQLSDSDEDQYIVAPVGIVHCSTLRCSCVFILSVFFNVINL